jgi:hypothetical protein
VYEGETAARSRSTMARAFGPGSGVLMLGAGPMSASHHANMNNMKGMKSHEEGLGKALSQ